MKKPTRASIYAVIPPLVALAVGVGWLTTTQGAVVAALAVEAVTLGFACYYAVTLKAPLARTVVYGFLAAAAAAAVVWGLVSAELAELVVAAVMAGVGIVLAESNTAVPAVEVGADGIRDDRPQRIAGA